MFFPFFILFKSTVSNSWATENSVGLKFAGGNDGKINFSVKISVFVNSKFGKL